MLNERRAESYKPQNARKDCKEILKVEPKSREVFIAMYYSSSP